MGTHGCYYTEIPYIVNIETACRPDASTPHASVKLAGIRTANYLLLIAAIKLGSENS